MKIKFLGLAMILSVGTMLGACHGGTKPTNKTTPAATTTPTAKPATQKKTTTPAATTTPTTEPATQKKTTTPAATTKPETKTDATPAATPNTKP